MLGGNDDAAMHECSACGLLWVDIYPSPDQLARYYKNYMDADYVNERDRYEPNFRARHPELDGPRGLKEDNEDYIRVHADAPSTVLDLGGGSGIETPFRGLALVDIFDINPVAPVEGCIRIDEVVGKYDLVVLAHVLEHIPDPIDLLKDAADTASGFVFIEVPAEASAYGTRPRLKQVAKLRRAWHEHIQYFDETSLEAIVETSGLACLDVSTVNDAVGGPVIRAVAKPHKPSI